MLGDISINKDEEQFPDSYCKSEAMTSTQVQGPHKQDNIRHYVTTF